MRTADAAVMTADPVVEAADGGSSDRGGGRQIRRSRRRTVRTAALAVEATAVEEAVADGRTAAPAVEVAAPDGRRRRGGGVSRSPAMVFHICGNEHRLLGFGGCGWGLWWIRSCTIVTGDL